MMHTQTAVEVTCLSFNGKPFSMEEAARRMMDLYPDRCLSSEEAWQELEASGLLVPSEHDPTAISFAAHKLKVVQNPEGNS
ncbi:hypothetical protein [Roseimicrobium gellanilyticum]|nr:hypothetical protein [Roseimicrobium gellanilyticum]